MPPANVPDLGVRQLVAVLAVAEYGSFIAAAALLKTSQPALTRTVQRVEDVLGVSLFERTTRRVKLTPAGREFVAVAERVLNDLRITARSLRELAEEQRGQVIVSSIMSVAAGPLPPLVARYRADRPAVEIYVREGVHGTVLEDIRSAAADLGITYMDELPDAVAGVPLGRENFQVVLPGGHRLAARDGVALADLAGEPLVSLPNEARTRRIVDAAASVAGVGLWHAVTVTQFTTMLAFVRAGVGPAVAPAGALAGLAAGEVVVRPITEPRLGRDIGVITLRERELAPAAAGFLSLVREEWPRLPD